MSDIRKPFRKVSLVSLGCDKNLADSEHLLRFLEMNGVAQADRPEDADIVMVNTCSFIEDATRESVDEILRLSGQRKNGTRLLVFGCLARRHGNALRKEIPEIDALFGIGDEKGILDYCRHGECGSPSAGGTRSAEDISDTAVYASKPALFKKGAGPAVAPLKIADGCSRRCSFCIVPSIRGPYKSRKPDGIIKEAESYISAGVRELAIVAQDITLYGKRTHGYSLPDLVGDIASIPGDFRIRLLYLYPTGITDRLLDTVRDEPKVCKYLDIPLQHSEDRILKLMRRGGSRDEYLRTIRRIRQAVPGVALRTTFIAGFPGERNPDFEGLLDFVNEVRFERAGAFLYSREEGTPAAKMRRVPHNVALSRLERLMAAQSVISLAANRALVGTRERVLIDEVEGKTAIGRISTQTLEVDGVTFVKGGRPAVGEFMDVTITRAMEYDLEARAV